MTDPLATPARAAGLQLRDLVWTALRPALRIRLALFRRAVRKGTFPPASAAPPAAPVDVTADRVAWVGNADAGRFGVLEEHLGTLSRVAAAVGTARGRPFAWVEGSATVLTVREAADESTARLGDVDAVVVALGFSDVLLMTSAAAWRRDLDRVLDGARHPGSVLSPVLVAGIPPIDRLRLTSRWARGLVRTQIGRLNAESERLVRERGDCAFVPFPEPEPAVGSARLDGQLWSWRRVHELWAGSLWPELARLLDETS
ncbi:hypothetical protein [Frigoribacterium faeni]|uniref:hypothetical protein n=1 Tax=Frigoribacterium faeni TaxID=145483 RepID=UPI00141BBAB2|nr:hypothetical protein [Frigoribacterium faeni]NIJ06315.1 hypothetical protein [Frigoribacterium faeni]